MAINNGICVKILHNYLLGFLLQREICLKELGYAKKMAGYMHCGYNLTSYYFNKKGDFYGYRS